MVAGDRDERSAFETDESAADYDQVVDWGARLPRELPFFRELLEKVGVETLVDVGCGTGKHAIEFASWGLRVTGIDPSAAMLVQAQKNAEAAGVDVDWELGGYGDVEAILGRSVDAVVSLGNAFMHVDGPAGAAGALADIGAVVRPGGVVALHFLNYERLLSKRPRMMPARFRETSEGDKVFVRLMDYEGDEAVRFEFLTLSRLEDGSWDTQSRISRHAVLPAPEVVKALEANGFGRVEVFGSHDRKAFDPENDESVVLVGYRESAFATTLGPRRHRVPREASHGSTGGRRPAGTSDSPDSST